MYAGASTFPEGHVTKNSVSSLPHSALQSQLSTQSKSSCGASPVETIDNPPHSELVAKLSDTKANDELVFSSLTTIRTSPLLSPQSPSHELQSHSHSPEECLDHHCSRSPSTKSQHSSSPHSDSQLSLSSEGSSVDDVSLPSHVSMLESGKAVATHLILTHPPMLSRGRIMPNAIWDFKNHTKNYYMNAKHAILDNEKVTKILRCFKNPLINVWISVNHSHLQTLTFKEFMLKFCTHWLPKNWIEDVWNKILGLCLDLTTAKCINNWRLILTSNSTHWPKKKNSPPPPISLLAGMHD